MATFVGLSPSSGTVFNTQFPVVTVSWFTNEPDYDFLWEVFVSTNPNPDLNNSVATGWYATGRYTTPDYAPGQTTYPGFTATLDISNTSRPLQPGTYYVKLVSFNGEVPGGPWTTSFTVQGVAIATPILPNNNSTFAWSDANPFPFVATWTYSGMGEQSAYQLVLQKVSDNSIVADSGKVMSSSKTASLNIPTSAKDIDLTWKVRVWDAYDSPSLYTSPRSVLLGTPPTLTITAPTNNQVLTTGTPSVTATVGTAGGRTVKRIVAELWEGVTKVWEKVNTTSYANGAAATISDSSFYMKNLTPYTYRLTATDSKNLVSTVYTRDFSVSYTLPATPGALTVSTALYDTSGYNSITWSGASPDADFYAWEVEREDSLIDVSTGSVVSTEPWKRIGVKYVNQSPTNEFRDYSAPSNYQVRYRVRQVAYKFNTVINGNYSTSSNLTPATTSYWLYAGINGDSTTVTAIPLHNVTGDNFSEELEESEFTLMGRGRYVERGTELGVNGTLECKLRNTAGSSARVKRLALKNFKSANLFATLRTPFGDSYQVSLGGMQVGRVAGTGRDEFVDVSIPYKEVVNG